MTFKNTKEQDATIELALTGKNIRIQAFAGASKTHTLNLVANQLICPSLYLAYNKSMAEEAKQKFPDHVEVRTTHSLAYSYIGKDYLHKLNRPKGAYVNVGGTGAEIAKLFKVKDLPLSNGKKVNAAAIGLCIKEAVNNFEFSADTELSAEHLPWDMISEFNRRKGFSKNPFIKMVLKHAKELWEMRIDKRSIVMCTHDTYMKLFQLTNPILSGYDVVYLDEAQDVNPCLLAIFNAQECQKIAVGDSLQSIYQWRGSVNAMDMLPFEQKALTKSFRFGKAVADIATQILRDKDTGVTNYKVEGYEIIDSRVYKPDELIGNEDLYNQVYNQPHTMLFRTNAALLQEAVRLLEDGVKLNIESDMKDFVKLLQSALNLYTKSGKVTHQSIIPFDTWKDLEEESKSKGELSRVAKIIKQGEALRYIDILEKHYDVDEPDVVLTTAHKSKGREWDIVVLGEDFPDVYKDGQFVGLTVPERNLLYVACTRAKKVLVLNQCAIDIIERKAP